MLRVYVDCISFAAWPPLSSQESRTADWNERPRNNFPLSKRLKLPDA